MEEKVTLKRAFDIIDHSVRPLGPEPVEVMLAGGRILAERISAWVDVPGADCSTVDGYAVRCADMGAGPSRLKLAGSSSFISPYDGDLPTASVVSINSGVALPEGADAVVPAEAVRVEGEEIVFAAPVEPGSGMRKRAAEFRAGETVAERGLSLKPGWISLLVAAGWSEVQAVNLPRVRIIAAGDELRQPGRQLEPGHVYPSAAASIFSWCKMIGVTDVRLNVVADDPMDIQEELPEPIGVDLIITLGGTGFSDRDVMIQSLEERGTRILFRGIKAKPGHFAAFGMLDRMPVVCLPGGPSAAEIMFQLLARRVASALMGHGKRGLPSIRVKISETIEPRDHDHLVRVRLPGPEVVVAHPMFDRGIHREIAESDGIALIPAGKGAEKDSQVEVWLTR